MLAMLHRTEGKIITQALLECGTLRYVISTKGGAGGATTTVSTLPQLSAAASAEGARVIIVQGAISGAAKVQVTSDKTIVGKAGSCMSTPRAYPASSVPYPTTNLLTSASSDGHWPDN